MSLRLRELKAQMEVEGETIERTEFEAKEWQKILLRFPQIRDIEANFRICQNACDPMDVSLGSIVLLIENPDPERSDNLASQLSLAEPEVVKRELIDKIAEYLNETTSAEGVVENRRKLMAFWSLENLRKELRRIESVANLHEKPASELRQIVRAGRSVPGLPELPRKILIHGEMVKLDAARIKRLDRDSLKTLIRKWGPDQVNSRLREEQ